MSSRNSRRGPPAALGPVRALVLVYLSLLLVASSAPAATIHVPADQPTVQAGINAAAAGDTVLIDCGTYHEHNLVLKSHVRVEGATGATDCVIIDAARSGGYFSAQDLFGASMRGISFHNGVRLPGLGANASEIIRSSVSFENCRLVLAGTFESYGYANCYIEDSPPTFDYCAFTNNSVTGVAIQDASPEFRNCSVSGNLVQVDSHVAAGMSVKGSSTVLLEDCTFASNDMYCCSWPSTPSEFSADDRKRGLGPRGLGLYVWGSGASLFAKNCVFRNQGNYSGSTIVIGYATALFENCEFKDNWGFLSSVLYTGGSPSVSLVSCTATGNHRDLFYLESAQSLSLANCAFWDNEELGVYGVYSGLSVSNSTFHDQSGHLDVWSSTVTVERSIFTSATSGPAVIGDQNVITFSCSDIFGNTGGDWVGEIADQADINGNFSADPLYCDPANGNLTLSLNSPCLPGNHPDGVDCGLIGAFGLGCGATGFSENLEAASWASVKSRYRSSTRSGGTP